jgi:uncharacterized protein (DUF983 family)
MRISHHSVFIGTPQVSPAPGHDMIVVFLIIVFLFIVFLIITFFFIASNAPSSLHFIIALPFVVIIFVSSRASSVQRQSGK